MIGNWCEESVIAVKESGKMDHDRERGKKMFICEKGQKNASFINICN